MKIQKNTLNGAIEYCIDQYVRLYRDREILRAWNTRADLFLFPSTFDTNGLVVREAAACGLAWEDYNATAPIDNIKIAEKHNLSDSYVKDILYGIGDDILLRASAIKNL